jgi:transcriptional regulator with XRE-family HTH domain
MNRIKELRLEKGLTQSELAKMLSCQQTAIGKYERGELEPNIRMLKQLSEIFECSIDFLVFHSDDFGNIEVKNDGSPDKQELLALYSSLPKQHKAQILDYVRYFAERSEITKQRR